jgi:hypothetical protein
MTDLEFCFDPEDWWPSADHSELNDSNNVCSAEVVLHPSPSRSNSRNSRIRDASDRTGEIEVTFINVEVMEYFKKFLLRNHFILEERLFEAMHRLFSCPYSCPLQHNGPT